MFTGVSSPLTLLGKSSDLEVNGEALDGNQSDELPASPVIGSTNRKCSNSVASVDCRECPYMEGFCPLPAEVEMIDVPIADVADGRVGSKRKKSKRESNFSSFLFRSRTKFSTTYAIVPFFSRSFNKKFKFLKTTISTIFIKFSSHSTPESAPACTMASK